MFQKKKVATELLEEDLCRLRRRVDELESANKRLELEWTELYDKVRHQMSRMAKRYAVREAAEAEETPTDLPSSHLDSLDPISKSIMLRRAHTGIQK